MLTPWTAAAVPPALMWCEVTYKTPGKFGLRPSAATQKQEVRVGMPVWKQRTSVCSAGE